MNPPRRERVYPREYPYVHLWELEEMRFRMRAMTYSDKPYLCVNMPGYILDSQHDRTERNIQYSSQQESLSHQLTFPRKTAAPMYFRKSELNCTMQVCIE
eukprot:scaffold1752_cov188-Amphora_coffeaeformis.AAC.12